MIFRILIKWQTPLDKRLPTRQLFFAWRIIAAPAARFATGLAWAVFEIIAHDFSPVMTPRKCFVRG